MQGEQSTRPSRVGSRGRPDGVSRGRNGAAAAVADAGRGMSGARVICIQECLTPYGSIYLAAGEAGLCRITIPGETAADLHRWLARRLPAALLMPAEGTLDQESAALAAFFDGEPLPQTAVELLGTPFQVAVWRAVLAVPYGETRSYAEIGRAIGHPLAGRAVGAANAVNPLPFVVPCHRIIGADGSIKGYPGGVITRRMLLDLERGR